MQRSALTISLHAPDVAAAVSYYRDILGFEHTGEWVEEGKPLWSEVTREGLNGTARIWFYADQSKHTNAPTMTGLVYLFLGAVDDIAATLGDKVRVRWGPEDMPYGLRELGIEDLNGYLLVFAEDI